MAIYLDIMFSNMKRNEAIKQLEYLNKVYGEQPCDTCTNDKGCVTCKDGELWEGKEQPCEDLEKAAEKFVYDWAGLSPTERRIAERAYLAGAEWQAERLLKGSPMPEDTVIFQKGIEEGKRQGREEMFEELRKISATGVVICECSAPEKQQKEDKK